MQSYRELMVWQKSIDLVSTVYEMTRVFPKEEVYGLTSQMRRAAVSIPSNIAEGFARKSRQEYRQFIRIAFSSGAELETQIVIAKRLGYITANSCKTTEDLLQETMKMLNKMITVLSKNDQTNH